MNIRRIQKTGYWSLAALLLTGTLLAGSPATASTDAGVEAAAGWDFKAEASDLLDQVQLLTGELREDSGTLASPSYSNASWQSHATQLTLVREHINQIGDKLDRLQEIRHVTSPWQQQAIDRVVPAAVEVATHTQGAIEHLTDNQGYLFAPVYQDHLSAIAERADDMKTALDKFLDYGDTRQKLERLQLELEMTES